MARVELIDEANCPNVEAAREQLRRAFQEVGQPAHWQEWDRGSPSSPVHAWHFGSPTILVDSEDVAGVSASDGAECCRVYQWEHHGLQGVPTVETITSALRNSAGHRGSSGTSGGWRSWLAVIPAVGVATLPNLTCPACWPAYAGLLGSIGLGFQVQTKYLLLLTLACLALALGALAFRARSRHGYGPFLVGLAAAMALFVGKFLFESDPVIYGGIALLIGTSAWNTWPTRTTTPSGRPGIDNC